MKHFQDCYQQNNKQLLESLACEQTVYKATVNDIMFWFNVLNEQLFDNTLTPINKVYIRSHDEFHALYTYYSKKHPKYPTTELRMGKKYKNKKVFVEVLAHEMVHHYQFLFKKRPGHGKSFKQWKQPFEEKGLRLLKTYEVI